MKVTELKKTLGFYFREDLRRISPRHSWASIKCNEQHREMVLTASADDPAIADLMGLVNTINSTINKNWPDCNIQMRLAVFSLTIVGGRA